MPKKVWFRVDICMPVFSRFGSQTTYFIMLYSHVNFHVDRWQTKVRSAFLLRDSRESKSAPYTKAFGRTRYSVIDDFICSWAINLKAVPATACYRAHIPVIMTSSGNSRNMTGTNVQHTYAHWPLISKKKTHPFSHRKNYFKPHVYVELLWFFYDQN